MEMVIDFPGGARVDAHFGPFTVPTDQYGAAPAPFAVFLASIGTCAGIYVLGFCQQRGLPTDGLKIIQRVHNNPLTGLPEQIDLEIQVPAGIPEKYHSSLIRAAELCKVKKTIETPPVFNVTTRQLQSSGAGA